MHSMLFVPTASLLLCPTHTQSWVVSLFLDCPARIGVKCPNSTAVASVKAAIRRGDITWHALPHNAQVRGRIVWQVWADYAVKCSKRVLLPVFACLHCTSSNRCRPTAPLPARGAVQSRPPGFWHAAHSRQPLLCPRRWNCTMLTCWPLA